jgi:prepilin-type processing-associated H-X9-DG protein
VNGGGINVTFADGAYYYLVGQEGGSTTAVAHLTAAARHLYQRVHR